MGYCNRPRTREYAPTNSGSRVSPERLDLRCSTEECGRALSAVFVAKEIWKVRNPSAKPTMSAAFHHVIIPVFEKVIRAYRFGSSAERAAARVYLQEFVPVDDYIRNRHERYQQKFSFV